MKTIYCLILLSISPILVMGQQFSSLDSTYLLVTRDFKTVRPGDTIHFHSGGISLINTAQLNAMQEIIDLINQNELDQAIQLSIEENEKKIGECKTLYETLLFNSEKSHEITNNSLRLTLKSMEEISATLENTKIALALANENVTHSQGMLKKYQSAKIWQNILVGLAGVGLGVLITR